MKSGDIESVYQSLSQPGSLIAAIVQDHKSREVLMLAWMNREALDLTVSTKRATFWSRSRNEIWVKGQTSGAQMDICEIRFDCDSDAILLLVNPQGPACHTGEKTCFHNAIPVK
jgi:phosphoribosyl-AMP cyclohydrolase